MTASSGSSADPLIATLTMNPALDITTTIDGPISAGKLRCGPARYDPGGGGINVARVAHILGAPVTAVFPAGGTIGEFITDKLVTETEIAVRRVEIAGTTRENFTVNEPHTGRQYRFTLPGPNLSRTEQIDCLNQLWWAAGSAQYIVASGSLPPGVAPDFYQRVADMCRVTDVRLVLDTSGTGIVQITSGVFLLKTDPAELGAHVGRELCTQADQVDAAGALIEQGCAENVVISLGRNGALLITAAGARYHPPVVVQPGGGVGAGDALVAAITVGLNRGVPLDIALRLGVAAGAAALLAPGTVACQRHDIEDLLARVPDSISPPNPISTLPTSLPQRNVSH